jgi:SAM-dependent methyltransferase
VESFLYDELARAEEAHWWARGRRTLVEALLARHVEERLPGRAGSLHLLDVGCGTGYLLEVLRRFGEVEGLETSPDARAIARKRMGEGLVLHERPLPEGLPADARYDVVTAFDVLEHLEDPAPALRAIRSALRPEGFFLCTVPAFPMLWSAHDELHHHFRRYRAPLLREQLEQAGFAVRWMSHFNTWLFPGVAAVRLAQRLLPRRNHSQAASDLGSPPPAPLNSALEQLFASERHLLARVTLPFGVSLAAVGTAR